MFYILYLKRTLDAWICRPGKMLDTLHRVFKSNVIASRLSYPVQSLSFEKKLPLDRVGSRSPQMKGGMKSPT